MIVKLAKGKSQAIDLEQRKILSFYKQLFNYKHLYIFPPIIENTLHPLIAIDRDQSLVFYNAKEIDWLNYYHETFTKKSLSGGSSIDTFFKQYDIDVIYPIRLNDECYGFLAINSNGKKANDLESKIAALIVRYLASIWFNQDLLHEVEDASVKTERMLAEISSLMEVTKAIETGGNIQGLLEVIMEKCMKVMAVEAVSLLLVTNDRKHLKFRVALGPKGKDIKPYFVEIGKGIAGTVAKTGQSIIIEDAYKDKRFDQSFDERSGFKTKGIMCVPLVFQKKRIGVVQALNRLDDKSFNEQDLRIFTIFARQAALAIQNARLFLRALEKEKLESQIAVASEIQRLIVPEQLPELKGLELGGTYIPSQGIGGDFYTVIPLNETECVFCIADVSGKSVPGALLVSTLHASLKAYLEFTTDLKKVIQKLNTLIIDLSTADRFITLFVAKYNSEKEKLYYISAGHNPQFLIRNSQIIKLSSTGICVGIMDFDYKVSSVDFKKNDTLVLYTDGIVEARNLKKEVFGDERFEKTLLENSANPLFKIQDQIIHSVKRFSPKASEQDDLTLLLIRKK
jgi:sigma-B regulation protein RsbU (phosphoserine phosphatase)